jgi:hypothetical protein
MGPKEDEVARAAAVAEAMAKHTLHLKKSMGGFRGSFARIITNSDKLIGFARCKDTKSLCLVNELTDYQVTLKNGYEKLSHAYALLLDDLPDDLDDDDKKNKSRYEAGRDEIDDRYMDLKIKFLEVLAKLQKPLPENQPSGYGRLQVGFGIRSHPAGGQ